MVCRHPIYTPCKSITACTPEPAGNHCRAMSGRFGIDAPQATRCSLRGSVSENITKTVQRRENAVLGAPPLARNMFHLPKGVSGTSSLQSISRGASWHCRRTGKRWSVRWGRPDCSFSRSVSTFGSCHDGVELVSLLHWCFGVFLEELRLEQKRVSIYSFKAFAVLLLQ